MTTLPFLCMPLWLSNVYLHYHATLCIQNPTHSVWSSDPGERGEKYCVARVPFYWHELSSVGWNYLSIYKLQFGNAFHPTFYNGFMLRLKLIHVDKNGTHVISRFRFTQFILRFAGNILRLFTMVIYISVVDIWDSLENLETIWPHNRISLASHPMPGVHALQMLIYRECHAFWISWIIVYFKIWIIYNFLCWVRCLAMKSFEDDRQCLDFNPCFDWKPMKCNEYRGYISSGWKLFLSWTLLTKLLPCECPRLPLTISQHGFR